MEQIQVCEIRMKVYLMKDIKWRDVTTLITGFIDSGLAQEKELLKLHESNCYKMYSFDSLYPISKDGIYHKDRIYSFRIRTLNRMLAEFFSSRLVNHYTVFLKGLSCKIYRIPQKTLEKVFSATPIIIKTEEGYWREHLLFQELEERIKVNLIKKYNFITGEKLDEHFELYTSVQFINHFPVKVKYKGIHLLGDKLEFMVTEHPSAQKLMYLSLAAGLGEMNSRGYGFVNFRWR